MVARVFWVVAMVPGVVPRVLLGSCHRSLLWSFKEFLALN